MTHDASPASPASSAAFRNDNNPSGSTSLPWWLLRDRLAPQLVNDIDLGLTSSSNSVSPPSSSNGASDVGSVVARDRDRWQRDTSNLWTLGQNQHTTASPSDSLPTELLINVLQHLPSNHDLVSAMLVSKTWCLAAFPLIWQRPPIHTITQFAKFVRTLNDPDALLPYATTVRRLICSGFARDLTDKLFVKVSCCRNLERLFLPGADLSDHCLVSVFRQLPELISIDLGGIDGVTDLVARQIASVCTQVQGLNFTKCKRVGDEGIIAIASNLKMLRRMKLHGCHRLTDRAVVALVRHCPLLSELDIMGIPQLSNDSTLAVFLNAVCLRDLKMRESKDHEKLDDNAIPNLWELSRMGESQLFDSLCTYPWYLTGSSAPKAQAISHRSSRPPNVSASLLRPLRSTLDVLRVVDFTSCSGLGDLAVENLVCNAPQLRSLTLTKCDNLSDASLDSISRLGKYIHYLHLGHVNQITDAGILQLSRNCTRLRYIDVANCSQLTDLSVAALAQNLPKLRRIGLVKVTNVTDDGLMLLADRFLTLERIHLSWCDKITIRAIAFLLNRLPHLTHLSLSGIPAFKTVELQRYSRTPPEDLNEGQRSSFCVYSGPGIAALRNYLNASLPSQELSDASSGRRSSGSSTSSITIPGPSPRASFPDSPGVSGDDQRQFANPDDPIPSSSSGPLYPNGQRPYPEAIDVTQAMAETGISSSNDSPSSPKTAQRRASFRAMLERRRSNSELMTRMRNAEAAAPYAPSTMAAQTDNLRGATQAGHSASLSASFHPPGNPPYARGAHSRHRSNQDPLSVARPEEDNRRFL